nr:uncharacterized protein LOC117688413 [Crassostrea gigas]
MRNLSLISSTCLTLCLILECASASFKSQNVSHKFFRHEAVENGNVMKNMLEPNELDKPKNINNQAKTIMRAENYEHHLPWNDKPNAHRKPNRGKRTFFADDLWPNRIIPFKINYGTYINSMFKEQLYHNSIFKLFFVFIYFSY